MLRLLKFVSVSVLMIMLGACGLIPDLSSLLPTTTDGSITLSASPTSLVPHGKSGTLTVTLKGDNNTLNGALTVNFVSSNESVVSVPSVCQITIITTEGSCSVAVKPGVSGYATITASATGLQSTSVSIAVATAAFAYISDLNAGAVYTCPVVGESGEIDLTKCSSNQGSGLPSDIKPYQITLNQESGSRTYAYVPTATGNSGYGDFYVCSLDSKYALTNCRVSNGGLTESTLAANAVAFNTQNGVTNAYAVSAFNNNVFVCGLGESGLLESCAASVPEIRWESPTAINFATTADGKTSAYVLSDVTGKIYKCSFIPESIDFSRCLTTEDLNLPSATAMTFRNEESAHIFYVASTDSVQYCKFTTSTGDVSDCKTTPTNNAPSWPTPIAIAYHRVANTFGYVYVSTGNNIWKCSAFLKDSYGLSNCLKDDETSININPTGLTFYDIQ